LSIDIDKTKLAGHASHVEYEHCENPNALFFTELIELALSAPPGLPHEATRAIPANGITAFLTANPTIQA
jgi:hypothetical protein